MSDNDAQADYWSSDAGRKWITHEAAMDASMTAVLDRVLALAALAPGQRVLDIGCGAGATTGAAAARVGPTGHVTGADISTPLLARARERFAGADRIDFLRADAQTHDFGGARFDRVISRFRVMFFADPEAAFANIRRAMLPGARLAFACWGDPAHIPWFAIPAGIAAARLGPAPEAEPTAPGPTAFRDAARVRDILSAAGFSDVGSVTENIPIRPPGTPRDVAELAGNLGPASFLLRHHEGDAEDRRVIVDGIAAALPPYETETGITLPCEVHLITATA